MNISKKLSIIVLLTIIEISITLWAVFELSKAATFHQLNFLHLKYNAEFTETLRRFGKEQSPVKSDELRHPLRKKTGRMLSNTAM